MIRAMPPAPLPRPDDVFGSARSMSATAAAVPPDEAAAIAAREYGLTGTIRRLTGERDQIFLLRTGDDRHFTLKIIHPAEDPAVTDFQSAVLLHVARNDPTLPIQRILPTRGGLPHKSISLADGSTRTVRITTYLSGALVAGLKPSDRRAHDLGRHLARLQHALAGFSHPADRYEIPWDVQHTHRQAPRVAEMETPAKRALLREGLARFEQRVRPALGGLRAQVVHNDLSGDNAVVDAADHDRVTGILDFGDATRTHVVCDVAVAMAYALHDAPDALAAGLPLLAGFASLQPLRRDEAELLLDLIIARMVVRVGITEWRARRFPDNRTYILRNTPLAWRLLENLLNTDPVHARSRILAACGLEK